MAALTLRESGAVVEANQSTRRPLGIDQMLVEIPARHHHPALIPRPAIVGMRVLALHLHRLGHREIDPVIDLAELLDPAAAVIFLIAEITARHADHDQPPRLILLPEALQRLILRRETAHRRGVGQKDRLAGVVGKPQIAALDILEHEIMRRRRGPRGCLRHCRLHHENRTKTGDSDVNPAYKTPSHVCRFLFFGIAIGYVGSACRFPSPGRQGCVGKGAFMDENNQAVDRFVARAGDDGNVMERVLNAFDGLYDNATTFISGAAASAGEIGGDLGGNAGEIAGSLGEKAGDLGEKAGDLGEKAGGVAAGIGATVGAMVGDGLDAAVTFAKGLLGG